MNHPLDAVQLVRLVWPNHIRVIGEPMFQMAVAAPSKALQAAGSGGADHALRFEMKTAIEFVVAAVNITKLAIEIWRGGHSSNRAAAVAELDRLIRSKVRGQPAEESLLLSKEYAALIEKVTAS